MLERSRRSSASVVDEFFSDNTTGDLSMSPKRGIHMSHLRTGLMQYRAPVSSLARPSTFHQMERTNNETQRRESSSLVESVLGNSKFANTKLWIKNEPTDLKNQSDKLNLDMLSGSSHLAVGNNDSELHATSRNVSDSLWEDIRASISMTEPIDCTMETKMDIATSQNCDVVVVKQEPMDQDWPSSCQFGPRTSCQYEVKQEHHGVTSKPGMSNAGTLTGSSMLFNQCTVAPPVQNSYMGPFNSTSQSMSRIGATAASHMFPPTPPSSQPGSPSQEMLRRTPPPPYPGMMRHVVTANIACLPPTNGFKMSVAPALCSKPSKPQNTHPGCSTIKYNRKNNPELEKRRIHYCEFPGKCRPLK